MLRCGRLGGVLGRGGAKLSWQQQLQHVPPSPCLSDIPACPAACLLVACRERHIPLGSLEEGQFDNPLGEATGAGVIFGNTGGVMEAALRTAYELVSGG